MLGVSADRSFAGWYLLGCWFSFLSRAYVEQQIDQERTMVQRITVLITLLLIAAITIFADDATAFDDFR